MDGDSHDHQARGQDVATDVVELGVLDENPEQVAHQRQAGDQRPDRDGAKAQARPEQPDEGNGAQAVIDEFVDVVRRDGLIDRIRNQKTAMPSTRASGK